MIIVAAGDSFTYGAELKDQSGHEPSNSTTPALLAKSVDAEYVCIARAGFANNAISRQVINECHTRKGQDLFVYVMWTFQHRYEFRFNYNTGRRSSPWHSINLWDIIDNPAKLRAQMASYDEEVFESNLSNKALLDKSGVSDFSKNFYKHVGSNDYYEVYSTLKELVFLQQYLKSNKIPYLFTTADLYLENAPVYNIHSNDVSMAALYDQVDWSNWFSFPAGTKKYETCNPRGFYQWAVENKYSCGPNNHPLEQAHQDAALLMKDKFDELVKKSL